MILFMMCKRVETLDYSYISFKSDRYVVGAARSTELSGESVPVKISALPVNRGTLGVGVPDTSMALPDAVRPC